MSTYESNSGLGVTNRYGPVTTQNGVASGGELAGQGGQVEYVVYLEGAAFESGEYNTRLTIPAGFSFEKATAEIDEAFVLGGTTPTINVGTDGSAGTNYVIELSEANAEATGTYVNSTGAGTFANPLTADTAISVELDGTSPTVTSVGRGKVVIRGTKI